MLDRRTKKGRKTRLVTYEQAKKLASECLTRTEMVRKDATLYKKALSEGWIEEFFPTRTYTFRGKTYKKVFRELPVKSNDPMIIDLFRKIYEKKEDLQYLSKMSGVAVQTMHRWRNGQNSAMLKEYVYVCQALGYKLTLEPEEETEDDTA